MVSVSFKSFGHSNVLAKHKSTLEFTTESNLTIRGDCILGVKTTTNLPSLPEEVKEAIRKKGSNLRLVLKIDEYTEEIKGNGHPDLLLEDDSAVIIRKSNFICPKTLMINSNKAAIDISDELRLKMKNHESVLELTLYAESGTTDTSKQA